MNWQWYAFKELSISELYTLLKARQEVFVIEQECVYLDLDDLDRDCWHLCAWQGTALCAYLRLLPPDLLYSEVSIGRLLTSSAGRGRGIGKELLKRGIEKADELFPSINIRIAAQQYLESFYQSFEFKTISKPYDEDGITHVDMLLDHRADKSVGD